MSSAWPPDRIFRLAILGVLALCASCKPIVYEDPDALSITGHPLPPPPPPLPEPPPPPPPPKVVVSEGRLVPTHPIQFDSGVVAPTEGSEEGLVEISDYLREHPELSAVAVEVHTDDPGTKQANLKLGKKRAAVIIINLTDRGVDPARLSPVSHGNQRPIDVSKSTDAPAANRRVEFVVLTSADPDGLDGGAVAPQGGGADR